VHFYENALNKSLREKRGGKKIPKKEKKEKKGRQSRRAEGPSHGASQMLHARPCDDNLKFT